jgi:hypothetical protein
MAIDHDSRTIQITCRINEGSMCDLRVSRHGKKVALTPQSSHWCVSFLDLDEHAQGELWDLLRSWFAPGSPEQEH